MPAPAATGQDHPLRDSEAAVDSDGAVVTSPAGEDSSGSNAARQQQWVRSQQQPEHDASRGVRRSSEHERPRQSRDTEPGGKSAGKPDQVGADDRAHSRGDQHDADSPAAPGRRRQICTRIPGLQIGGHACAVDGQRGEEQRNIAKTGRRHDSQAAQGACQVPGAQPGATAQTLADSTHADGGSSRTDREKDGRQPREAAGAQHVLGKQCTDCDARGQTGAAQDLCQQQSRERPPLLRRLLDDACACRSCGRAGHGQIAA